VARGVGRAGETVVVSAKVSGLAAAIAAGVGGERKIDELTHRFSSLSCRPPTLSLCKTRCVNDYRRFRFRTLLKLPLPQLEETGDCQGASVLGLL